MASIERNMRYYRLKKELGSYTIGKIYPFTLDIDDDEYWQLVGVSEYYSQQRNRLQIVSSGTTGTLYSDGFVLPKYWYIKLTSENFDIIKEWFIKKVPFYNSLELPAYECFYIGIFKKMNKLGLANNSLFFDKNGEISFEQFKKYIIGMENNAVTSKIIGYKLKYPEYKEAITKILGFSFNQSDFENDINSYPDTLARLAEAKVLGIWFEPLYEVNEVILYFGDVKFILNKDNDYAETEFGKIKISDIKKAIDYIENPPKLGGHFLTIHTNVDYTNFSSLDRSIQHINYGFGCKKGTLKELKAIYHAYCELNNINK